MQIGKIDNQPFHIAFFFLTLLGFEFVVFKKYWEDASSFPEVVRDDEYADSYYEDRPESVPVQPSERVSQERSDAYEYDEDPDDDGPEGRTPTAKAHVSFVTHLNPF